MMKKFISKNPLSKMSDTEKLQNRNLTTNFPSVINSTKKINGVSFNSNEKISNDKKSYEKKSDSKKSDDKSLT